MPAFPSNIEIGYHFFIVTVKQSCEIALQFRVYVQFIVCNMGIKPSPLGETFRSTSCGFQKISWKA